MKAEVPERITLWFIIKLWLKARKAFFTSKLHENSGITVSQMMLFDGELFTVSVKHHKDLTKQLSNEGGA